MPIFMNLSLPEKTINTIEIDSFSFGANNTTTIGSDTGRGSAGKVKFNEMTITKQNDKASPAFLEATGAGVLLPAVQLTFFSAGKAGETPYLQYTFQNVLVTSVQWASSGDNPTESVSLAFEKMVVVYENLESGRDTVSLESEGSFWYLIGQPSLFT